MNDAQFEKKVSDDVDKTKKDLMTLGEDGITGVGRRVEQLADDARKTIDGALKAFNKEVGHGLRQYNEKVQDVADRVPGDFSKKAAGYPWVTVTLSLVLGLLLGVLLKSGRPLSATAS